MSANSYTATQFLADVRRKGHIPPSQTPFLDDDLLAIATEEQNTAILRQIRTARENYYLTYDDLTTNTSNIYTIPERAIAGALQDVHIVNGSQVYTVQRTETNEQFATDSSPTGYWSFLIIGNQIKILPTVTAGTIRLWYLRRPNTLVVNASSAQVTAVSSTTLTFASIPSTFSATGATFDCINAQPPFGCRFVDYTPTSITSTTMVFSSLPTDEYSVAAIKVGDWVSLAGQTSAPQMPVEFWPLLVQRTVCKYYEIQGYKEKMEIAEKKLKEMEKDVFELINPRVANEPKRIISDSNVIGGYRRWRGWRAN